MTTSPRQATTAPSASAPAREVLHRLAGPAGASAIDALGNVSTEATELEAFRPLAECLEWRLADAYWSSAGVLPFVRNDVPYLVNNTGRLSENAAALVFAACDELGAALPASVIILELGAGAGLHARYFLDAFADRCRAAGRDFYDRLLYVVSDRFEKTVAGWQADGVFDDHLRHVALRVCDARVPDALSRPGGEPMPLPAPPLAVFCNYLLDVLPSTIARRTAAGLERLCVRTHLAGGAAALRRAGLSSLDDARALAARGTFDDLTRLLPLLPQLDLETAYHPWIPAPGLEAALAVTVPDGERVILNIGALACLESLLGLLSDAGFLLINDYGPVRAADVGTHLGVQRFGGSVALGLNFPSMERALGERGMMVTAPDDDGERRVHTRLVGRRLGDGARQVLRTRFSLATDRHLDAPQEQARQHAAAGRRADAVTAYRALIERNPGDWQMLGEAAEFVGLQMGDHAAGLDIVRAALERNPWYSAWLWNILGDCLFYREKLDEAHDAFLQALHIDPDDPRTNLNLAYTLSARGQQGAALLALAHGLAHDRTGAYRPRLLEKQSQVLAIVAEQASSEQQRLARRAERFR